MTPERLCACPCKRPLEGRRKSAKYFSAACRTAAWKDRRGITGIRYVKASQNAKKPSGVQISLGNAFEMAEAAVRHADAERVRLGHHRPTPELVREYMLKAVPPRQLPRARAQVERERVLRPESRC